jgi:glycosyltransferase involved in cell wall biosynthesis
MRMWKAKGNERARSQRMPRPLRIAYVGIEDPTDKRSWSGTSYYLAQALQKEGHHLHFLGPLRPQPLLFFLRMWNQVGLKLFGKRFHYRDSALLSKAYAGKVRKWLASVQVDVLLAPAGLAAIAYLRTEVPIVHFNDRSIAGALDYHAVLKNLFASSRRGSLALERRALRNAALTIYASEWAADAARIASPQDADKVRVVPMGANFEHVSETPVHVDFPPAIIKLLFIGTHWTNKGGDVAYTALQELKKRGFAAQLVVCGCNVPAGFSDPDVVVEGFLRKSVPAEAQRLQEHLRAAHFFILPTRFEAYGIAFCEAAAYGIPALGSHTGGVPTVVQDGATGFLLPLHADGAAYADRIEWLLSAPERWQQMRASARKRYEEVLTWKSFVKTLAPQMEALLPINNSR